MPFDIRSLLFFLASSLAATAAAQSGPTPSTLLATADRVDHLVIDDLGDSSIVARGRNWKTLFTPQVASFVPFFGSEAPRNFPVDFAFEGAHVGMAAIELPPPSPPEHTIEGTIDAVLVRRGSVTEIWRLAAEHVEQRFEIATRTGRGDLTVRMRVRSELTPTALPDGGFRFANEHGGVHYGRAEAFDARGRRSAVKSALTDGVLELTVPASFHDDAVFPLTIDPVVSVVALPLGLPAYFHTDVAYLGPYGGVHALVFEEAYSVLDHDVWLRLFDDAGLQVGGGAVDVSTFNWAQPKIAANRAASQFLVVAARNSLSYSGIWGRTVKWSPTLGLTWSPQFAISGILDGQTADVGGDPNASGPVPGNYCVTWNGLSDGELHYNIVRTDGSLAHANGAVIDPGTLPVSNPSISKSCGIGPASTRQWIVAWQQRYSATDEDIFGSVIAYTGSVPVQSFLVDYSTFSDSLPSVSSPTDPVNGQERFLVTFQRSQPATALSPANFDVMASSWTANAAPLSGTTNLSALLQLGSLSDQLAPNVDSDGARFVVGLKETWPLISSDVRPWLSTVHITAGGALAVTEYPVSPNAGAGVHESPRIAARRSGGTTSTRYTAGWSHSFLNPIFGGTATVPNLAIHAGHLALAPSQYFQPAAPSCGPLTLTASGVPSMGDTFSLSLTGSQGIPLLLIGPPIAPLAICTTCLIGVDLNGATLLPATNTWALTADPLWIGTSFAAQGVDLLATGGCSSPLTFTLSNSFVVTIL